MQQHERARHVPATSIGNGLGRGEIPTPGWFTAHDAAAVPVIGEGVAPRTIAIFAEGQSGTARFHLSAGAAAELMFQIGYALEQAAILDSGRVPLPRIGRIQPSR